MPVHGAVPSPEQYAAAIAAIQHAIETSPGLELPPLGQDRQHEDWVAGHARYAVSVVLAQYYACPVIGHNRCC